MSDCNVFEYCRWLRHFGKVMVLVVLAFAGLSVWAVVGDAYWSCISGDSGTYSGAYRFGCYLAVLSFLSLVYMLLWSYFVVVSTDPGRVPQGWTPFADEEEADEELERLTRAHRGPERLAGTARPRYCRKCMAWKPPRAHHDSITGRCVLKMDHYCVWVLNCVGLLNYKAFLLFLAYSCAACGLASALLIGAFVRFLIGSEGEAATPSIAVFIAFVVDAAFTLCLVGFLVMHARLVAANCTTIEMYEKRRVAQWPYDRGFSTNFREIFGYRAVRWLLPAYTSDERAELLEGALRRSHGSLEDVKLTELAVDL